MDIQLAISQTKIKMLQYKKAAFFSYLALRLPLIVNNDIKTAATDGYQIFINEEFFLSLTVTERVFLLFHEVLHVALQHNIYKGNRDDRLWNVAADYVINALLKDYDLPIPSDGLYDSKYAGLTTEKVYNLLEKEESTQNPTYNDLLAVPQQDSNNANNIPDNIKNQILSPEEASEKIKEELVKTKVAQELSENKDIGTLPADIERFFNELVKPKLPWTVILSRFLNKKDNRKNTFKKPNRRYYPNFYLPSKKAQGLSRIDFVIDTSGSISKEEFTEFLSEVNGVLKQFKPKEIGLTQFDSKYYGTDIINKYTDLYKITFKGGGGTYINSTLKELDNINTEVLIIFTDGYIELLENAESNHNIIWCIYDNKNFNPPIGKVLYI